MATPTDAASRDLNNRRLAAGLLLSMLLHALVLSLQFGVPGLRPGPRAPLTVTLAPPLPAVVPAPESPPVRVPAPPEPATGPAPVSPSTPVPGLRLVDPAAPPAPVAPPLKPRRRISRHHTPKQPKPVRPRVIAQEANPDSGFKVPLPQPEQAAEQTTDPIAVQDGADTGTGTAPPEAAADQNRRSGELAMQEQAAEQARELERQRQATEQQAALLAGQRAEEEARARLQEQQRAIEQQALAAQRRAEEERADRLARQHQEQARQAWLEQQRQEELRRERDALALAARQQADEQARRQAEQMVARQQAEELARQQLAEQQARRHAEELVRQRMAEQQLAEERLAEQRLAEQRLVEQRLAEQRLAEQRLAEQRLAEQRLAEQRLAEQQLAQQRLAEQRIAEQQARRRAEELAQQQLAEQQAARRRAEEFARQQADQAARAARQAAEQQRGLTVDDGRSASRQGIAPGGPGPGEGGGGGAGLPRNALGSNAANRARELVRGLDLLGAPPPAVRDRDQGQRARRAVVGAGERDVPLRLYVDSVCQKIERNGSASQAHLAATRVRIDPLVSVTIRSDGSIEDVVILRSSGHPDLDEAVRHIVRVNARYSAFPPNVAARYDLVEVRRIWAFAEGLKLLEEVR